MEGSLQSFKSFITEERQPYKVVILTVEHGDKSITAKKFEKQAKKMGFQTFLSNFKGVFQTGSGAILEATIGLQSS